MTISNTASYATYTGNGAQLAFDVKNGSQGIYFAAASELTVTLRSGATITPQTISTHYTVSGAGTDSGQITFLAAPANGVEVRIERNTSLVQNSALTAGGAFNPSTVMAALDKLTREVQDIDRAADQSVKLSLTDLASGVDPTLPVAVASKYIGFNASANGLDLKNAADFAMTIGTVTTGAPGSGAVATLTGTPTAAILNLTIPRGDTGASGGGSGDLLAAQNLNDLASKKTGFDNISIHGADVASASTIDLDAATGNLVDVTGTTTITAITLANGRERTVRFTGILTLTNGASLVLPGGANIATEAGDVAIFRGYAAGVVRCVNYQRLSHATFFADIKQASTTAATGVVELATTAEAATGTDTTRAVVPTGLFPAEADVASATTTDLGAATTTAVRITGTTTITSFGTANAGIRRSGRFAGALTLTHNATSLILPSAANIATAAGDTFDAISLGSGNWIVTDYTRATGRALVGGKVISRAYAEYTSNADLTTQIPVDDTIPQNTEGTEILSASITPSSTSNIIRVTFSGFGTVGATANISAALFQDSTANALAATTQTVPTSTYNQNLGIIFEHVPGTTSAVTYKIRVGSNVAQAARMNGSSTARIFGGVARSVLILEELAP